LLFQLIPLAHLAPSSGLNYRSPSARRWPQGVSHIDVHKRPISRSFAVQPTSSKRIRISSGHCHVRLPRTMKCPVRVRQLQHSNLLTSVCC
jgi:hypothetical protein